MYYIYGRVRAILTVYWLYDSYVYICSSTVFLGLPLPACSIFPKSTRILCRGGANSSPCPPPADTDCRYHDSLVWVITGVPMLTNSCSLFLNILETMFEHQWGELRPTQVQDYPQHEYIFLNFNNTTITKNCPTCTCNLSLWPWVSVLSLMIQ